MSSGDREGLFWKTSYSLRVRKLNLLENTPTENSFLFDEMNEAVPGSPSAASTLACEGMIEAVNGAQPRSGIPAVENAMSVKRWMAISDKEGIVPDLVFVTLTSETGKTFYIKAHSMRRDDNRRDFNQPGMPDPGFAAMLDVSSLNGGYSLGLARTYKGNLGI